MSWPHLAAIVWLRWRLAVNQFKRGSGVRGVLTAILVVAAILIGFFTFTIALAGGIAGLGRMEPDHIMFLWDAVVAGFLLFWLIGVVTELQRSESLSLDKLLHLPISPRGAFLLNYVSSLASLALIVFAPAMLGLALASVIVLGPAMLVVVALVFTVLLMITAVTYQFRGWLAVLMMNKRRRGTVIATVTLLVILLAQLPNLLVMGSRDAPPPPPPPPRSADDPQAEVGTGDSSFESEFAQWRAEREERNRRRMAVLRNANLVLPPGWLPYGAREAAAHHIWPGVLGCLGAAAIGAVSLGRSYRTTLRIYTGEHGARRRRRKKAATARPQDPRRAARVGLLERRLPGIPEQAAAVALASFRALSRAPQAKMIVLTPIILLAVFGVFLFSPRRSEVHEAMVPLIGLGVVSMTMICLVQILQNQFGFDRDGFRALVLSGAARRDVLLGKNLSLVPLTAILGGLGLLLLQVVHPMKVGHLAASFVQLGCVLLICSMVGNVISILAPIAMSATSLKPAEPKAAVIIKQMVLMLLFPLAIAPSAAPLGVELLLDQGGLRYGLPVYAILSLLELGVIVWIYRLVLESQGRWLQRRELKILEEVTRGTE